MQHFFQHKKILITGGAGFLASHLVDRLVDYGAKITIIDNLLTGSLSNLKPHLDSRAISFINADVSQDYNSYLSSPDFEFIFHLASPASPVDFATLSEEIYRCNAFGSYQMAKLARALQARLLYSSTSEAYGDPLVHPQGEDYLGNVNPVGPRACYDESKRFGEMVFADAHRIHSLDMRIVRIFNTYGPRMRANDGRVIPAFINQALTGQNLTIHGDGSQTRSYCYVDDLVEYLLRAMAYDNTTGEVINIGNPQEKTIIQTAEDIIRLTGSKGQLTFLPKPIDDPQKRQPILTKAQNLLDFSPQTDFETGIHRTISYFQSQAQL